MWKLTTLLLVGTAMAACGYLSPPNALADAARAGSLERIAVLVGNGADVNEPSGVNGWTPVLHAIHKRRLDAVRRLTEVGASFEGDVGRQALLMASGYGDEPMVRFLLERGLSPRADGDGGRRVMAAAVQGASDIDYRWSGCAPHTDVLRTLIAYDSGLRLGGGERSRAARAWAHDKGCDEMLRLLAD